MSQTGAAESSVEQRRASPVLSWLALIFGSIGILVCIAALIGVFSLASRLQGSVDTVFTRVGALLENVRAGSDELTGRVASSRESVAELREGIDGEIEKIADEVEIDLAEFDALSLELRRIAQHLKDWLALAGSAREFALLIDELIESTMIFLRADDETRQSVGETLENGRVQLEEAVSAFDELVTQWENVRGERGPPPSMEPLFARIDGALGLVEEHTGAFASRVGELEEANRELQSGLKRRILFGAVMGAFLIAWQGVAQWCLACWGWRKRKASVVVT